MSFRFLRCFVFPLLVFGLAGCGGGGIDEGMPDNLEEAEAEFEREFRGMQTDQGDDMLNPDVGQ